MSRSSKQIIAGKRHRDQKHCYWGVQSQESALKRTNYSHIMQPSRTGTGRVMGKHIRILRLCDQGEAQR